MKKVFSIYSFVSRCIGLICLCLALTFSLNSCKSDKNDKGVGWQSKAPWGTEPPGFRAWIPQWNKSIKKMLEAEIEDSQNELSSLQKKLKHTTSKEQKDALTFTQQELEKTIAQDKQRLADGDYIQFSTIQNLPSNLTWENGLDQPDIGDPAAQKGGSIHLCDGVGYPSTFRSFGPNSNSTFRSRLHDEISIMSNGIHPVTGKAIPGVCNQWALSPDKRTVYFKINPKATYSDGAPIKALDFIINIYVTASDFAQSPYNTDYYRTSFSTFKIYDEATFSVTLPSQHPNPMYDVAVKPAPPHFYSEYGPDFPERYQWRIEPTTGGYTVHGDGVIRGRQITLSRVKNWWAKDLKYYHYMCNVDYITHLFIGEASKVLEQFRMGEIDIMLLLSPATWHEKMEIPEVHNGYIQRATLYTIYPRYPLGLYLNVTKHPLDDINVRLGLSHAMNNDKINDVINRGDYQKLNNFCSGYGEFTNPHIKAREYSPLKARQYFAKAGYTIQGKDGYLRTPQGEILSIEITYSNTSPNLQAAMSILKEEAKKAGVRLELDDLDTNVCYRKVMEKRHQAASWAWGASPPYPRTHQCFHSSFAKDEKGNPKADTNNINCVSDKLLDAYTTKERDAHSIQELKEASWAAQQRIHDLALWIPSCVPDFTRIGYWRWIKWPQSNTTHLCYPTIFDPTESHLYWIDQKEKEETLKAKREGKTFEEVDLLYDEYRGKTSLSKSK